ncbi:MAG: hypothetical protein Q8T11_12210 [Elusimicrobiota bacterium]|nr:hypothetical protein [Elusimicrobiota bacterium]
MAQHKVVIVAVNAVNPDAALARRVAKSLLQPHKTPKQIVEDLLERLGNVKRRRELRGLNHWGEFAPAYLQRMLVRHEVLRRRAVEEFFRLERDRALARAQASLGDRAEAEDAVGEAFLKLLAGKTGPSHFYRLLSQVCIGRKRMRKTAGALFSREREFEIGNEEQGSNGPGSSSLSEGDPLEILLHEEAIQEGIREVQTNWEHRRVRDLQWWNELVSHYGPEDNVGKRRAETHM